MNECKIVEDLLPLYAEELTNEEASEFVRKHVERCESCHKLLQRCYEPVASAEDPKAYKKALRKNQFNLICKAVLLFILVIGLLYAACTKLDAYMKWKDGRTPVEQVIEAPTGLGKVTLVDWEASGYKIGNTENKGTLIYIKQEHVVEGDWKDGGKTIVTRSVSEGGYAEPWENVQVEWAPNETEFLLTADLPEGGIGMFVYAYEYWEDETGGFHSASNFLPGISGNGLVDVLIALCTEHPDFSTGWETVEFTFHEWKEDSETITFVYETDNGCRGLLDYHFPTETITKVN